MRIGIIGNGTDKFSTSGMQRAFVVIDSILGRSGPDDRLVSGHSPVGGIDIWAEERAKALEHYDPELIFSPKVNAWNPPGEYGFKARNIDIAKHSDELHIIVASDYPVDYRAERYTHRKDGQTVPFCYHCMTTTHVKSCACRTGIQFQRRTGISPIYHIINNE